MDDEGTLAGDATEWRTLPVRSASGGYVIVIYCATCFRALRDRPKASG